MPPTSQPDAYIYRWHACFAGRLTWIDRSVGYGLASVHGKSMRACTHAGPRAFGRTTRARCELRLPQRRDALHADVLAAHRSSDVSKPSTSVGVSICRSLARGTSLGATVCSRQRCALLGRCSCSAVDAAGWAARRRSQLCKHTEAPFRNLCRSLRESMAAGIEPIPA